MTATGPDHTTAAPRDWHRAIAALRESLAEGGWTERLSSYVALMDEAAQAGQLEVAAEAASTAAKAAFNLNALDRAEALAHESLRFATEAASAALQAAAWVLLASVHARADRPRRAVDAVVQALEHLGDGMPEPVRRTVYLGIDLTYGSLGLWRLASEAGSAALALDAAVASGQAAQIFPHLSHVDSLLRAHDDHCEGAPDEATALLAGARRVMAALEQAAGLPADGWLHGYAVMLKAALQRRTGQANAALALLRTLTANEDPLDPDLRFVVWFERAAAESATGDDAAARRSAGVALERLDAASPPAGVRGLAEQQHLWRAQQLAGDTPGALRTLSSYHQRVLRNTTAWMDARSAGLTRQLSEATLRLQNADLREHNAGLQQRVDDIARVASTDGLTGVLTRRALAAMHEPLASQGRPFALLMVDVDHFKAVNDRHGHVVGDRVLCAVARQLQQALRAPDHVGRYGGEEFVVLVPGVTIEGALAVAERLRKGVAQFEWPALADDLAVTISVGCAVAQPGQSFEEAVQRADRALYRAKAAGRNRVQAEPPAGA